MKVSKESLDKLDKEYNGYLEGETLDRFFGEFDINFAAGHWCAGDFADRFAPGGYNSLDSRFSSDIVAQIERIAQANIKGIEFHEAVFIDKNYRKDSAVIERVKEALKKNKVIPTSLYRPQVEVGRDNQC